MATFDDLNDDVLLKVIDVLFDEDCQQDPANLPRSPLTALASTNRRLRFLAIQVATRSLFHSVSIWGGSSTPSPALKLIRGEPLDIPAAIERTRFLRIPNPYADSLQTPDKERSNACLREFTRLLRTPKRLEKLDVQHSKVPDDLDFPFHLCRDAYDNGGDSSELSLPFTLDHVKELWIHPRSRGLVPQCPNVRRLKIRTRCHRQFAWRDACRERALNEVPDLLSKCAKLPHLVSLEIDLRIEKNILKSIHAALPNLERLAFTGLGIRFLPIEDRGQVTSHLSRFPRLQHVAIRLSFDSSSRPWGDSPDEPPDYRISCLVGGPCKQQQAAAAKPYFARHAVRFFERCPSLRLLSFLPGNWFRLLRREPDLKVQWLRYEEESEEDQKMEEFMSG